MIEQVDVVIEELNARDCAESLSHQLSFEFSSFPIEKKLFFQSFKKYNLLLSTNFDFPRSLINKLKLTDEECVYVVALEFSSK